MTTFDARAALRARDDMERQDYLLSAMVRGTLPTRRWWTLVTLKDAVGAFYRGVTVADVARVVRVYEAMGMVVTRRVKGRKDRLSTPWALRKANLRGGASDEMAAAIETFSAVTAEARVRAAEIRAEQHVHGAARVTGCGSPTGRLV